MANYYNFTHNNNQAYNGIPAQQFPAYGSYASVSGQGTYMTSSNPAQVQTQAYLSYAQQQPQQSGTVTAANAGQHYQQTASYYSTPAASTATAQFSKPANYYPQPQQAQQTTYYSQQQQQAAPLVIKNTPHTYSVTAASYNNATGQQQVVAKAAVGTTTIGINNAVVQQQQQQQAIATVVNKTAGQQRNGGTNNGGTELQAQQVMYHHAKPQQQPQPQPQQQQQPQMQQHVATAQQVNKIIGPVQPARYNNHQQQQQPANHHHHQQRHQPQSFGGPGTSGGTQNYPYWKQKRLQAQQNRDPNKPIVASEVKAYLYAWLGKYKSRPDYKVSSHQVMGSRPITGYRTLYVSELTASGFDYTGKGCASNKKDSQTRAAWDFCDYLVREKKLEEKVLPTREAKFEASKNRIPTNYKPTHFDDTTTKEGAGKIGQAFPPKTADQIGAVHTQPLKVSNNSSSQESSKPDVQQPKPLMSLQVQVPAKQEISAAAAADGGGKTVATAHTEAKQGSDDKNAVDEALKPDPVGESYVEQTWTDGRVIRYRCSLCECEFNDPSTRDSHVRGRRHRLNYKQKVDPTIVVEIKLNPKQRNLMMQRMQQDKKKYDEEMYRYKSLGNDMFNYDAGDEFYRRRMPPPPHPHYGMPHPDFHRPFGGGSGGKFMKGFMPPRHPMHPPKSKEDHIVMTRHNQIYPNDEELQAVQKLVQVVEASLRKVSEKIHEEEMVVFTAATLHNQAKKAPEPLLKAVMRIGALAKGLLLHGDLDCKLVLVCNEKPTKGMVKRVASILPAQLQAKFSEMNLDVDKHTMHIYDDAIVVESSNLPKVKVTIRLTSPLMRPTQVEEVGTDSNASSSQTADQTSSAATAVGDSRNGESTTAATDTASTTAPKPAALVAKDPPDLLDRKACCQLLAKLRHVKWFQAKASSLQSCVVVIRIVKDLCKRTPTWKPLSTWAIELLVQRCLAASPLPLSPYGALLFVFKSIASGIMLEDGAGLADPCERVATDAFAKLTPQQREDITASAQHALRLLSFRKCHEVLGLDEASSPPAERQPDPGSKRPADDAQEQSEVEAKRVKTE